MAGELTTVLGTLGKALEGFGDAVREATDRLAEFAQGNSRHAATPLPPMSGGSSLQRPQTPQAAPQQQTAPQAQAGPLAAAAAALGTLATAAGALTAAFTASVGSLTLIPRLVQPFVSQFNPGAVVIFNQALDNLSATIGQAFEPVFLAFTEGLKAVTAVIGPLFEQLRPAVEALATSFVNAILPVVEALATLIEALLPLVDAFAVMLDVVGVLAQILSAAAKIAGALLQAFLSLVNALFGGLFGDLGSAQDAVKSFKEVVYSAVRAVVLFAARLLHFLGFESAVKRLKDSFTPNAAGRGVKTAAPKELGYTNFEEAFKASNLASAQAMGGAAGTKTAEESLSDIGEAIQKIIDNGATLGGTLRDIGKGIIDAVLSLPGKIARALRDIGSSVIPSFAKGSRGRYAFNWLVSLGGTLYDPNTRKEG